MPYHHADSTGVHVGPLRRGYEIDNLGQRVVHITTRASDLMAEELTAA